MTNREYMINLLLDGLESRLNRVSIDDGGVFSLKRYFHLDLVLFHPY